MSLQHGKSQYLCIRSKLKICTEKTPTTFSAARRRFTSGFHYSDVITSGKAYQTASRLLGRLFRHTPKKTSKLRLSGRLSGESTGGRCIPLTNGQWRGKCFHLMTSSFFFASWRLAPRCHGMDTFSTLLVFWEGNPPPPPPPTPPQKKKKKARFDITRFLIQHLYGYGRTQIWLWTYKRPLPSRLHYTDNGRAYSNWGIILGISLANERRRYIVTSSFIGYTHTQNYPWNLKTCIPHIWCKILGDWLFRADSRLAPS